MPDPHPTPLILPLGDRGLLVRFGDSLSDTANRAAIALAGRVEAAALPGVAEVVPNLISVLLRYDPATLTFDRLAGEIRLLVSGLEDAPAAGTRHVVQVSFDGEDLEEVAGLLHVSVMEFLAMHNAAALRVLATGFAPGFVYCGMHPETLVVPRRSVVRRQVAAGTVLFAAGQTAITSTPIPTGWHVIGHTDFRNFDPAAEPPTAVRAGDILQFAAP
ncbi:5-oxoprolinase subunit B family protein [Devosia sp. A16]|uniref:5-oxoprolinase subunit B family protein n=1 Tax=Devosia sp. A16 TaxID=1736675 RepID=UPI0006D82EFC|nr:carboxyltransferase domain-containing protein [Devosia sp. A16]